MARQKSEARRPVGRPPAGARDGEKVKDYPQLSVRLPPEVKAKVEALSRVASRPQWRILCDAIDVYLRERSPGEQRRVERLVRRSCGRGSGRPRR